MPADLAQYLSQRLAKGASRIGQVGISPGFSLRHVEDGMRTDLTVYSDPHAAMEIAKFDDAGKYRPLKTAPNLRHGWRLDLNDIRAVLLALDFIYPAAVGTLAACEEGRLDVVPLRATLARQSGLYAVVRKITDEEAGLLMAEVCGGCLRQRLWQIDGTNAAPTEAMPADELPVYCAEACNILVAAGRGMVKKNQAPAG